MAPTNKKEFPYSIRDLTTKDVDQYNQLLRYAFQVTDGNLRKLNNPSLRLLSERIF